jgi:ABC-type microcin C transport system permease subunit YejB
MAMGGESLDAGLEPIAQVLILIIVLIGVASIAFFIINKVAIRRKERAHNKLSTSRRSKHGWVDLSAGREDSQAGESTHRSSHRRSRRSSSNHVMLDILAKPKEPKDGNSSPDESSSA